MTTKPLDRLAELRGRELEQRQTALAEQQALHSRVRANLERLGALMDGVARAPACAAQALNGAAYKQSLLRLAEGQRRELAQRAAEVGAARHALVEAARAQQVVELLQSQALERARLAEGRQQQKTQDELATQGWLRGGPFKAGAAPVALSSGISNPERTSP